MAFGLTSWGIDALALRDASVDLPWAKLAIGLTFSLVIGGLAGWLTALIDHAAVGTLFWGIAGIAYAWLVGHLPFEGLSALLRFTEPHLGNIAAYPFVESARVRTILLMIIVGGLCALGGSLELVLLDQSSDASTGAVVLVDLAWPEGGHDLCVFEGAQPITLTRCTPAEAP